MADPTGPTEEELAENLNTQFDAYMTEIKRLIHGAGGAVKHAINTARINGYSLSDLIAIIAGEVKKHEDDPNNPHVETLAQLGGMDTVTFESQSALYFAKDALPISQVPSLGITVTGNKISIAAATMIYMGRKVALPQTNSTGALSPVNQYLKIAMTGKAPNRVPSYSLVTDGSEDITKFIVASITYANGVFTATPIPCVRIGAGRLSAVPHGQSIPVSAGSQAAPGSINPGWIG